MVQVFATKVWGLDFATWPLLTFPTEGYRRSFLRKAHDDDLVCFVATKGKKVADDDKGKLLGVAKVSSVMVNSESVLRKIRGDQPLSQRNYENGRFKWPFGLVLREAWYVPMKPTFDNVIGRKLKWSSVRGCELLSPDEARTVLGLKRTPFDLKDLDLVAPIKSPAETPTEPETSRHGPRGIVPPTAGYHVTHKKMTAFVYVLNFQESDIFKIGWAFDVEARAKDINQHIPSEILQRQWEIFLWRKFPDQFQAYAAEQSLLQGPLRKYWTKGERVKIGAGKLRAMWTGLSSAQ
jgi:hypothetical protein